MAAKKARKSSNIDWYLISIARLKQVGVIIVLVLLGVGGYFFFKSQHKDPRQRAEAAISAAQASLDQLATSKDLKALRNEFDRGQAKITEAKTLMGGGKFAEAELAALESQAILNGALTRQPGEGDSDAQFLTVEGDVQYQKSGSSDWRRAGARVPLFNGDWVRTSDNASAELIFSNGSLYTIGSSALLEIYSVVNPATSKKQNTVQMQVGSVEINTTDDISTIKTPGTQVVVDSESTAQVGVDRVAKSTLVIGVKGTATVSSSTVGGTPVKVASGELISATQQGALSEVRKIVMPPALLAPAENQVFQGSAGKIDLVWAEQGQAAAYQFQVSRSRLFTTLEIDTRREQAKAGIRITTGGSFYWRVAGVAADGQRGPFSTFRRFRVKAEGTAAQAADLDKTPPPLQVKRPFNIGGQFYMIEGKTEPGATVLINDQEVDTESDGSFKKLISFDKVGRNSVVVKAVDPAGNTTLQTESVYVEE